MAYRGISPGCKRVAIDLPEEMYAAIKAQADEPPAIPVSEWIRRVLAHMVGYPMPSLTERKQKNLRLTGEQKRNGRNEHG